MKFILKTMSVLVFGVLVLSGCSASFDPSLYIQTSLNAIYKGDFTSYTSVVGLPDETAQTNYENGYKSQVDVFAKMYSMVDKNDKSTLNDNTRSEVEQFYKEVYAQTFYQVSAESKAVDNGYEVNVTVKPLKIFTDSSDAINDFVNQFNSDITAGKYNDTNQYPDDMLNNTIYARGILNILKQHLDSPNYADPKTIPVRVMHNAEKNSYYINADDLSKLSFAIIQMPSGSN